MRNDLTEIVMVVDESGSMTNVKKDAEGGIEEFLDKQRKAEGDARVSWFPFSSRVEVGAQGVPISEAQYGNMHPGGMTALRDGIGMACDTVGRRLDGLPEDERPGLVVVVIVTDGFENNSTEYSASRVKEILKVQKEVFNWQFLFLCADEDAMCWAGEMGLSYDTSAIHDISDPKKAYTGAGDKVATMRCCVSQGGDVNSVASFTQEEREAMS